MKQKLMLRRDTDRPVDSQWYIVRKVVTKYPWYRADKVEWIPVTCKEAGYPRYGNAKATDIAYFLDDYCASCAVMRIK